MRGMLVGSLIGAMALSGCAMHGPGRPHTEVDERAAADVANIWYAPGRAIVCATGAVVSGVTMLMTLGQSYELASQVMHGGCSGPWTISQQDLHDPVP